MRAPNGESAGGESAVVRTPMMRRPVTSKKSFRRHNGKYELSKNSSRYFVKTSFFSDKVKAGLYIVMTKLVYSDISKEDLHVLSI